MLVCFLYLVSCIFQTLLAIQIIHTSGEADFVQLAVGAITQKIRAAQQNHGTCMIGLSGGATPRPVYEALGKRHDVDWKKTIVFLLDERCVGPEDPESNQKLIRETLLRHAHIPDEQIFFPDAYLPPQECADEYSIDLKHMIDQRLPDLTILGMGDDGHIASLFPPLSEEAYGETRIALHTTTDRFAVRDRISVGLNFIASAPAHVILLKGEKKKQTWEAMLAGTEDERRWPMKRLLKLEQDDVTVIFG